MIRKTLKERIEEKYIPEPYSGCWLWTGCVGRGEYGQIWTNGKMRVAHRVYYEMVKVPVPDGMCLDHLCRTPCCINPDHLEIVTPRENTLRGTSFSAINSKKTHCVNGHLLSPDNLFNLKTNPYRRCKLCERHRQKVARSQ